MLGRMRALLRHTAAKDDPVLRAAGVGMKTWSTKSSSVAVRLEAMIDTSAAHSDAFKAARIVDSDIALCRTLHDNLIAAEQEQDQAQIMRKNLSRDKNATQLRLEDTNNDSLEGRK